MNYQEITYFLLENGWTQQGIADEIGVSQPTVAAIVKGHSNIRATAADKLKRAYRRSKRAALKAA